MPRGKRKLVVLFADTHGGHRLGLMQPGTVLYDEGPDGEPEPYEPRLTKVQEYLSGCFEEDLLKCKRLARKADVVVIHAGDITHGDRYPTGLVSTRKADQVTIAVGNVERVMQLLNVKKVRLLEGTQAHGFGEGTAAHLVARQLAGRHPRVSVKTLAHGLFTVGHETLDIAHHGPAPGIRTYLYGNVLRLYTRSIMMDAVMRGNRPPTVLVRGHRHRYRHETVRVCLAGQEWVTEAFILPSYSGLTHHARQSTQSAHWLGTGLLALEFAGGRLVETHSFWREIDLRTKEEL